MRRMLLSTTAALLAMTGVAAAQSAQDAPASMDRPATVVEPKAPMNAPIPEKMDEKAETPAAADMLEQKAAAPAPDAIIPSQEAQQQLASDIMDRRVVGADDGKIGEITDLLLDNDRRVVGAVVAVGGFLGIGEKRVAIPWEEFQEGAEGDTYILSMTKEQLEQAPAFKTASDLDAERQSQQMQPATAPAPQQ
ncbi:PRC-barrel domain-containing protein [Geminicoccaceae bacterium 1502E]|nr:PRC-barrel domain-containing protein [Geminicoccaceae bacterium 1502E]